MFANYIRGYIALTIPLRPEYNENGLADDIFKYIAFIAQFIFDFDFDSFNGRVCLIDT